MTPEEKYSKIMEVMSDKTESLGCLIKNGDKIIVATGNILKIDRRKYKIIGHPLHIGDVLDWLDKQDAQRLDGRHPAQRSLLILWKDKRKPLQLEDTELIDYIYNLLP